jgi:hypothetical protein
VRKEGKRLEKVFPIKKQASGWEAKMLRKPVNEWNVKTATACLNDWAQAYMDVAKARFPSAGFFPQTTEARRTSRNDIPSGH